jgi:hypothetical protein
VLEGGVEGEHLAQGAGGEDGLGLDVRGHEALVLAHHQVFIGLFGGVDHGPGVLEGGGHGLLHQDVPAGLEGRNGLLGVQGIGPADDHRVEGCGLEHLLVVDEAAGPEAAGQFLGPGLVGVGQSHQLGLGIGQALGDVAALGDGPATDDSVADCHGNSSVG